MKRAPITLLVVLFFAFVAAALVAHVCLICYPDHPYFTHFQKALLAEGGQDEETVVVAQAGLQIPE